MSTASTPIYNGIWRILADWFCVPRHAPSLPVHENEKITSRRPAPGFRNYLYFTSIVIFAVVAIPLTIVWGIMTSQEPVIGLIALPFLLLGMLAIAAITWLAIRLRYDTTWYVFSDRSMRLRRGIWLIRETTITFENIQNVSTRQGPVQRFFGIADVVVDTAGGGGNAHQASTQGHTGLIEGIENASELRDAIREKIGKNRTSGLGDEPDLQSSANDATTAAHSFTLQHVAVLREIDNLLRQQ
ncbi:Bacterial membrane flanked domain protein [Roseimaritima multifibrata]|uniref:Bacterial membrane flanked domain protein n=1 Tax=Roseimaritima multifibrata TaxID=1930274 RepID=A0A517MMZ6_9BACT|nr:PH domain-containing protein [Roseimaritima multifibrata]QDS96258.1 Bacterial membrane flanked domain protein [Roseimaritima multifibrata]